jgi:hypothetical protein
MSEQARRYQKSPQPADTDAISRAYEAMQEAKQEILNLRRERKGGRGYARSLTGKQLIEAEHTIARVKTTYRRTITRQRVSTVVK